MAGFEKDRQGTQTQLFTHARRHTHTHTSVVRMKMWWICGRLFDDDWWFPSCYSNWSLNMFSYSIYFYQNTFMQPSFSPSLYYLVLFTLTNLALWPEGCCWWGPGSFLCLHPSLCSCNVCGVIYTCTQTHTIHTCREKQAFLETFQEQPRSSWSVCSFHMLERLHEPDKERKLKNKKCKTDRFGTQLRIETALWKQVW